MPTIVHFEIPADDVARARKFYADLFGWEIKGYPEMDYWTVTTSGEKHVDGGMMKRQHPQQPITNYIDVPNIDEYVAKVQKLGGKVVVPKMPVPTMGWFAQCLDTENNVFALWQSDKTAK
jgi:predicted enzyme related to lactoylglutathione lyase